jgi:hypothetical protein
MRLHIDWVNGEWDSMLAESTGIKIFVNIGASVDLGPTPCWLIQHGVSLSFGSIDQGRLTPHWLGVQKINWTNAGIHNPLWRLYRDKI